MGAITSKITSLTIVYSTDYSDTDQRKHQSSASLAFPHKGPVTRKMFPFDDVIMITGSLCGSNHKGPVMRSFDMFVFLTISPSIIKGSAGGIMIYSLVTSGTI